MHYRNGREAKNGDKVIQLGTAYEPGGPNPKLTITGYGILFNASPGNDYCNGQIAPLLGGALLVACMCDCLHLDDLIAMLAEKGLDKRPAGK